MFFGRDGEFDARKDIQQECAIDFEARGVRRVLSDHVGKVGGR